MLRSAITMIEQEIRTLQGRVDAVAGDWNDVVSQHVRNSHIENMLGESNRFYSDAYNSVTIIEAKEYAFKLIADRYR